MQKKTNRQRNIFIISPTVLHKQFLEKKSQKNIEFLTSGWTELRAPDQAVGTPVHCMGVGTDGLSGPFPTQHDAMIFISTYTDFTPTRAVS